MIGARKVGIVPSVALFGWAVAMLIGATATPARAQTLDSIQVAQLFRPVYLAAPRTDFSRAYIVQKNGLIRILNLPAHTLDPTPFLTIPDAYDVNEQGLLGLAFHPNYASNGYFYINYNRTSDGNTMIVRYARSAANPNLADPNSAFTVLRIIRGFGVHNGGWMDFGPDGYLYISVGDETNPAMPQSLNQVKGKILRIDVNGDDFPADAEANYRIPPGNPFPVGGANRPEIWAWGLRNPWRCGIDRQTGALFVADVGQQLWEEVNYQPPGLAGQNYGWPCMEGFATWGSDPGCSNPSLRREPFLVYGHNSLVAPTFQTGCAITGGDVYRGCAVPNLNGTYFFGDFCTGALYSCRYDGQTMTEFVNRTSELQPTGGSIANPVGFGADAFGEIYICDIAGAVYKIIPATPQGPDCNGNGRRDACDIAAGSSADSNGNGVPDDCENFGDVDDDGDVDLADLARLLIAFGSCAGNPNFNANADVNGSGCVDLADLAILLNNYGS